MIQRFLYDSTDQAAIPKTAKLVGAYLDGHYANDGAARKDHPDALLVLITVTGRPGAHVADVERYDLTPASGAAWAAAEVRAGRRPTIYCSLDTWPAAKSAVRKQLGWRHARRVSWWIADYDNRPVIPRGAVAKQYQDSKTSGGHYDRSVVVDYWPGVDPPRAAGLGVRGRHLIRAGTRLLNRRRHALTPHGRTMLDELEKAIARARTVR